MNIFGHPSIRPYVAFLRTSFLMMLAYRARYYMGILTYFLYVSVYYFIWKAVFGDQPGDYRIHGYTFNEMVTYVAVGWTARSMYYSNLDEEIDQLVRTGQIGVSLIRPVNFHLMMLAQSLGAALFRLCFFTVPIGIVILLCFPVSPPASIGAAILFFWSVLCAFVIFAELNFLTGLLAFALKSIEGISHAKYFLVQLLSGLLLPLAFFPESIRAVLESLPFQQLTYVPLQLYLGKYEGVELFFVLVQQSGWVVILFLLSTYFTERAMNHLTVQGG